MVPAAALPLQATPTPGVGFGELTDFWSSLVRASWFVAAFLVVALPGWFLLDPLVSRVVRHRNRNNPTIEEAVSRYVRLLVVVVALAVATVAAGYGHVLADSALVVAAATLAIGVAAQTVVGSFVSGLVLVTDPEFNVGDYIEWEGDEGVVQSITLRVTRVLTPDGELVTVPNTVLTQHAVKRPYGRSRYRLVDHVGLAYEDDVDEAVALLEAVGEDLDVVAEAPSPNAYVEEFGPDSVLLRVHYWIEDPRAKDVFEVRSRFTSAAKERLEAAGITVSPASKRDLRGRVEVDRDGDVGGDDDGDDAGTRDGDGGERGDDDATGSPGAGPPR